MVMSRKILARKYARAFLNLYFDVLGDQHVIALAHLHGTLSTHRGVLAYLSLPGLTVQVRQEFFSRLCENFVLPPYFYRLIIVLSERNNVDLLPAVVMAIMKEFWRRKHIIHFEVHSSHALLTDEQAAVVGFLTNKTGAAVVQASFFVDESLICGIKMRSDGYIFEHSVARELKKFEQSLLERVRI